MGHLYHGELLNNQMVYLPDSHGFPTFPLASLSNLTLLTWLLGPIDRVDAKLPGPSMAQPGHAKQNLPKQPDIDIK